MNSETGGVTLADQADVLFTANDFVRAEDLYRQAEAIFRRNGHAQSAMICLRRAEQCVKLAQVF